MADVVFSGTYGYSASTTAPPTGNQIRFNAGAPYQTVTQVWTRYTTTDGFDAFNFLMNVPVGATLLVQTKVNHALAVKFTVTAPPVDAGTHVTFAVAWAETLGTLAGGTDAQLLVIQGATSEPETPYPSKWQELAALVAGQIASGIVNPADRQRLFRSGLQEEVIDQEIHQVTDVSVRLTAALLKRIAEEPDWPFVAHHIARRLAEVE